LDDARAIEQIREGNDDAFDEIMLRYEKPLPRYLDRLTGDRELARGKPGRKRLLVDAYKGLKTASADLSLKAWLYRIATTNMLQHRRRSKVLSFIPFSLLGDAIISRLRAPTAELDERLAIEDALLKIPVAQRTPMVLHFVEGFRYREIAEVMGISTEAVRKRVARGSKLFRSEYRDESEGDQR
jgi:RNA polymerase sigma-70 factor (ECF subfamily)